MILKDVVNSSYTVRLPPYGATTAHNPTALIWSIRNVGPGAAVVYCGPSGGTAREYCDLLPGDHVDFQAGTFVLQSCDHLGTMILVETT
jgi:hypothetical protein